MRRNTRRRTMTATETERRADARYAESVLKGIFKDLPSVALRSYLEFLNASIEFLSSAYSDRWGITLFEDKIRLNVGWVEVLILRHDGLRVLVEKESLHQFGDPNDWKAFRRMCRLG
jgi:hypothetical protein